MINRRFLILLLAVVLIGGAAVIALAQGSAYTVDWHVVAGGGGKLTGEGYALGGTAGQPAAGQLASGDYTLFSGFWGPARGGAVYLPLVVNQAGP